MNNRKYLCSTGIPLVSTWWASAQRRGRLARTQNSRDQAHTEILVRAKCVSCPWALQAERGGHYKRRFSISFSLYFSSSSILKFCMGFYLTKKIRFGVKTNCPPPSPSVIIIIIYFQFCNISNSVTFQNFL